MNKNALIHAAQTGNLDAFNQLVIADQDRLFTIASYLLLDKDSAASAVQKAYILEILFCLLFF